jgi:flagellar motor switch protein FliG
MEPGMNSPLDGPSRCAILLYSLGMERASEVLNQLEPKQVKSIAEAAAKLRDVEQGVMENVVQDFHESMSGRKLLKGESSSFIQSAILQSGIQQEQEEIPEMGILPSADGENLGYLLKNEHPQTVALVLVNIDPDRAAKALIQLDSEHRIEVIRRIASLSSIPKDVLTRIEGTLRQELMRRSTGPVKKVDGIEAAADVLKLMKKDDTNQILEEILKEDGQLGDQIKQKMFTFDELAKMDDRGIRNLLKEIDSTLLAKALKVADDPVRDKIFKNMSERAAGMLAEDVEALPPMRLSEVEEAQMSIVTIATTLIQDGKAVVVGGSGGEPVV